MRTTLGVATLLLAVAEAWVYRMVALDMDGTALDSHHQLSDATVTFLRALYATGTIVSFCTGRSTPAAAPHIQRLGLDYMPVVAYNGAVSLIFEKNEAGEVVPTHELFKKPVPSDAAEQILRVAADNGLLAQYYVGHQIYVAPKTQQHRAFVEKYAAMSGGVEHVVVDDYTEPIGMGEPYKLLVFSDDVGARPTPFL